MEINDLYKLCFNDKGGRNFHIDKFYRLINRYKEKLMFSENSFSDRILFEFSINMVENMYYNDSIEYLKNSISLLENENYKNELIDKESYLKECKFQLGVAKYYTKQLNEAKNIFDHLYSNYPDDRNLNWLKSSIHWKYQQYINYLYIIAAISLVVHIVLLRFENTTLEMFFLILGIVALLTTPIISQVSKYNQKKAAQNTN